MGIVSRAAIEGRTAQERAAVILAYTDLDTMQCWFTPEGFVALEMTQLGSRESPYILANIEGIQVQLRPVPVGRAQFFHRDGVTNG